MNQMVMTGTVTHDAWIDGALLVWFVLAAISVLYVGWDAYSNNPELKVTK